MPITLLRTTTTTELKLGTLNGPPAVDETKLDRLLKMLPSEVIIAYTTATALEPPRRWDYYELVVMAMGVLAVVLSLRKDARDNQLEGDWRQYLVRSLAFIAWAILIGEPLKPFDAWLTPDDIRWAASFAAVGIPLLGYLMIPRQPQTE